MSGSGPNAPFLRRALFALLGGALGGVLAFVVALLFGYGGEAGHLVATALFASVLAMFLVDATPAGSVNWLHYCGKCALFVFLLVSVQRFTTGLM